MPNEVKSTREHREAAVRCLYGSEGVQRHAGWIAEEDENVRDELVADARRDLLVCYGVAELLATRESAALAAAREAAVGKERERCIRACERVLADMQRGVREAKNDATALDWHHRAKAARACVDALRPRPAPGEGEPNSQASLDGSADAIAMIAEERARQIAKLGYTAEHDDEHGDGAIAWAAACYAAPERIFVKDETIIGVRFRDPFPWSGDARMRKGNVVAPEKASLLTRIGLLVKAGALIAAEIDRLLRKAAPRGEGGER